MVEVNIPDQEPEPDIRPSSRLPSSNTNTHTPSTDISDLGTQGNELVVSYDSRTDSPAKPPTPTANATAIDTFTTHHVQPEHTGPPATSALQHSHPLADEEYYHQPNDDHIVATDVPRPHVQGGTRMDVSSTSIDYASTGMKSTEGGHHPYQVNQSDTIEDKASLGRQEQGQGGSILYSHPSTTRPYQGHQPRYQPKNDLHARFNLLREPRSAPLSQPRTPPVLPEGEVPVAKTGALANIGPIRPTKSIAELFTPGRKLGSDPGWKESVVNTLKCKCSVGCGG
jgi:hypothetical protein